MTLAGLVAPFSAILLQHAAAAAAAKSCQSCLTLCDPIDGSPPGSPVPGILQARPLEWGAIAFSCSPNQIAVLPMMHVFIYLDRL